MESGYFLFENLEWDTERSRPIGRPPRVIRTLASASVTCKHGNCGHQWDAARGNGLGELDLVVGNVLVSCPACGIHEAIPGWQLQPEGS